MRVYLHELALVACVLHAFVVGLIKQSVLLYIDHLISSINLLIDMCSILWKSKRP